jgi:hypothetical protein
VQSLFQHTARRADLRFRADFAASVAIDDALSVPATKRPAGAGMHGLALSEQRLSPPSREPF